MALNRSPTMLIDHRCSHPTRQFFNYNPMAHHGEGSQHHAGTRGVGRLRHDGAALIFVAVASALREGRWSMVVIRFLRPVPDPFLTLLNPISQCCWETTPGRMQCDWMGGSAAFLGTKGSPRIYFRMASVAKMLPFTGCGGNLQGGDFSLP